MSVYKLPHILQVLRISRNILAFSQLDISLNQEKMSIIIPLILDQRKIIYKGPFYNMLIE